MNEEDQSYAATKPEVLMDRLSDPSYPKSELEHFANEKVVKLEKENEKLKLREKRAFDFAYESARISVAFPCNKTLEEDYEAFLDLEIKWK